MSYLKDDLMWHHIRAKSDYWFTESTLAFFGSIILWHTLTETKKDWVFISKQDNGWARTHKVYILHKWTEETGVDTISKDLPSLAEAKKQLKEYVRENTNG